MFRKISSDNNAYKLRKGQPNLLCRPEEEASQDFEDTLLSTHRADFKKHALPTPPERGKRQELLERFLFEKISEDIAKEVFVPETNPSYMSTTHHHFNVPGFDPDARMQPSFQHSLYSDPAVTFWSENRRKIHGVTVPDIHPGYFHTSRNFSKTPAERFDDGEDW